MGSVANREKGVIGYYGSSLNEFVDRFCTREMTCMNIDCLLLRVSKRRLRFIEYKHGTEPLKRSQVTAFRILKKLLDNSTEVGWDCELYVVRGDYPFNFVSIQDIEFGTKTVLNQVQFIEWLEFERELAQGGI